MTPEPKPSEEEIKENAWNRLKHVCKDIGYAIVMLEVSKGAFIKVLNESLDRQRLEFAKQLEEYKDIESLFELQQTRMRSATKLWHRETGKTNILPDLGNLLEWLMNRYQNSAIECAKLEKQIAELQQTAKWNSEEHKQLMEHTKELQAEIKDLEASSRVTSIKKCVEEIRGLKSENSKWKEANLKTVKDSFEEMNRLKASNQRLREALILASRYADNPKIIEVIKVALEQEDK